MAILLASKPNTAPISGTYPYGNIKDNTGSNDGTPVDVEVYADFHQFFARMLAQSNVTPNGLPDNNANGFQYYEALRYFTKSFKTINSFNISAVLGSSTYETFVQSYGSSDLTFTLPPSATGNDSKTMALKANSTGITTVVRSGSDTIAGGTTFDMVIGDCVVLLLNGTNWEIVSYYNTTTVPRTVGAASQPTFTASRFQELSPSEPLQFWKDRNGYVHVQGAVNCIDATPATNRVIFILPSGYRPLQQLYFQGTDLSGGTAPFTLKIDTSGNVTMVTTDATGVDYSLGHLIFSTF